MGEEMKQEPAKEEAKPAVEEEVKPVVEEEKKEETPKPPPPFIMFIDLHCVGCAKKIERSILKIRGVEGVVMDMGKNEVTIKGVVDPEAVCNRIIKKTKRRARILSPLPEKEGEPLPQVVASQVSGMVTVELTVNMHCEACAQQLKKKILQMKGVNSVETEFSASKVMVTGTMDADRLVDYVYRRTKKQAKIVPQPEPEKAPEDTKPEEKKEGDKPAEEAKADESKEEKKYTPPPEEEKKDGGAAENVVEQGGEVVMKSNNVEEHLVHRMVYHYQPLYLMERIPAPQLFSDENPNACNVM